MSPSSADFRGFDEPLDRSRWLETVEVPSQIYSIDAKKFVHVSLDAMELPTDQGGKIVLRFRELLACFAPDTLASFASALLDALDGKRKSSTVYRWLSELSLFGRTVSKELGGRRISTVTQTMYVWYAGQKNASQIKLVRSAMLHILDIGVPGLSESLAFHLRVVPPPKPRSTIEIQNSEPSERPFSMNQVQSILAVLSDLYLSGMIDPQTHLLWRVLVSEAMRPSQMSLLKFGDFELDRDEQGRVRTVLVNVPMVKQAGTNARDFKLPYRLSNALGVAVADHFEFVASLIGMEPPDDWALFCVRGGTQFSKVPYLAESKPIKIASVIARTRREISNRLEGFSPQDLFHRRLKHTKLTHLAQRGATKEALAYAGYQTSTVSLGHYVNLTDESFELYEEQLESTHTFVADAFAGKLITRAQATYADAEHEISDLRIDAPVGACSREPCEALACLACYSCPRFEAFEDGPHTQIEAMLLKEQARAKAAGLDERAIHLRSDILAAVRAVIKLVDQKARNA